MNILKFFIPKQKENMGTMLGGIKSTVSGAMFYFSLVMFMLNLVVAYDISIKSRINIPFWLYLAGMFALFLTAMFFDYKYMKQSEMEFLNVQACKAPNPVISKLNELKGKP